jgi:hypothetical protein
MIKRNRLTEAKKTDEHIVLVNKKTGKVASTSTWLNLLAANFYASGRRHGIAGLLFAKGHAVLQHNEIEVKPKRSPASGHVNANVRSQAKELIPALAVLWSDTLPIHRSPLRKDFAKWVAKEMDTPRSKAVLLAKNMGFDELLDAERSSRWWLDQLEKMQS